jgi:hypothetical protein
MTLKERNERVESVRRMKEHFTFVHSQLQTKARSFEILSGMCEYLISGLESGEELDYDSLENFINNEYKRIVESNYGKR